MSAGMALSVRLLVYAGLSLFIINGLYVFMVVCVVYAYNLTLSKMSPVASLMHSLPYPFLCLEMLRLGVNTGSI